MLECGVAHVDIVIEKFDVFFNKVVKHKLQIIGMLIDGGLITSLKLILILLNISNSVVENLFDIFTSFANIILGLFGSLLGLSLLKLLPSCLSVLKPLLNDIFVISVANDFVLSPVSGLVS